MKVTRCSVDVCDRGGKITRRMCSMHYQRWRKQNTTAPLLVRVAVTRCDVNGCDRGAPIVHGMCTLHSRRMKVFGSTGLPPKLSETDRLSAGLVRTSNGCMEWIYSTNHSGYGQIHVDGGTIGTHRLAWSLVHGPIPDGLKILHHCDNPPCAQTKPTEGFPEGHLFLGSPADNTADMLAKGRHLGHLVTHCPAGHLYDEANTYVTARGHRKCRACHNARSLARYYKRRQEAS